jgi:integrase/recombinase XerD
VGHKEVPVTRLRKIMLEELQRRNFSSETVREYIGAVERFARYFGKPPDRLGPDQIRQYQAHLLHERKLAVGTVVAQTAGLRFFFVRTLKRRFPPPHPKYPSRRIPKVLSSKEVAQLIDAASNLQARAILMTLYSTGARRGEPRGNNGDQFAGNRLIQKRPARHPWCRPENIDHGNDRVVLD